MESLLPRIDHAVLKPTTTPEEVLKGAEVVKSYNLATLCIFPKYVEVAKVVLPKEKICAVVSFPLSPTPTYLKIKEAIDAFSKGAGELDVVVDLGAVKCGDWNKVEKELRTLRKELPDAVLKLIMECCYLTEEEKDTLCRLAVESGWDFLKTSTGYGSGGATFEDVEFLVRCSGGKIKVKAAGGIRDAQKFKKFLELGAERIGTSYGKEIAQQLLHSG